MMALAIIIENLSYNLDCWTIEFIAEESFDKLLSCFIK
jgi:hypothetical protein